MSMLTPEDIELTWRVLEGSPPSSGEIRIREIDDLGPEDRRPLFAIDSGGQRQLLLPVSKDVETIIDTRSSGVQVLSRTLMDRGKPRRFVVLVCLKPHLNELFSIIVSDILKQLEEGTLRPDRAAVDILDRWRELLERPYSEKPSYETAIGLYGELWQLRRLMEYSPTALSSWTGPLGSRHDFTSGVTALETKTSTLRQGRKVTIHGHEQLEAPTGGRLYMAVMKLERAINGGENLHDLFEAICKLGADRYELKRLMAHAGISELALALCDDMRFLVNEIWLYHIDAHFPKITAASFCGGALPAQVSDLVYTIDLTGEPPFPLSDVEVAHFYCSFATEVQQ